MPLQQAPHKLTKEGILTFGVNSAGKTRSWATIRKWAELTATPAHFHIISTEHEMVLRTVEGYLDGTPGHNFFTNATIAGYDHDNRLWTPDAPSDYDTLLAATAKIHAAAGPNDWVVIDSIGLVQTWSRDVWFGAEKGMSYRDFVGSGRKMKEVKPADWDTMAGLYRDWYFPYIWNFPGHRFACARMVEIRTEGDWAEKDRNILKMFGPHGVKPDGEKNLGFDWHSVLLCSRARDGWNISTVDDPERTYLNDEKISDFVQDYLMGVAGWQVT